MEQEPSDLQRRLVAIETQLADLRQTQERREFEYQALSQQARLQQGRIAELQQQLQQLYDSKTWRLTEPLRFAYRRARGTKSFVRSISRSLRLARNLFSRRNQRRSRTQPSDLEMEDDGKWDKHRPFVSVVIPCYNYGQYLEEAIDSVLRQTFQDFEIIVVNDGSTDLATTDLLARLQEPKTRVLHQPNLGLAAARNRGISETQGKYICCLDADDTLEPTYLEKAVAVLESDGGIGFAYSWARLFGSENYIWYTEPFGLEKLLRYNHVPVSAVFRRSAWRAAGGYNSKLRFGYEDWDFWLSLAERGYRGHLIPEPLFNHRRHGKTMTHTASEKHELLVNQITSNHPSLFKEPEGILRGRATLRDQPTAELFVNMNRSKQYLDQTDAVKILVLMPWLTTGGGERVVLNVLRALQGRGGYEFSIVTTVLSPNEWHDRFYQITPHIYHLPYWLPMNQWNSFLVNHVRVHQTDYVLLSDSSFGYRALKLLKDVRPGLSVVNLLHNDSTRHGQGDIVYSAGNDRYIDLHITVSSAIRDALIERYRVRQEKVVTIYNGVDVHGLFNPQSHCARDARRILGIDEGRKVVTFIGRLSWEKRPQDFLAIACALAHRQDVIFVLVGDGAMGEAVRSEIEHKRLGERVKWLPSVPPEQVPKVLSASDVFVLTSEFEGFPITALEALSMEVPVIAADVGGVRAAVVDGENGFLVEPTNVDLFCRRISMLLDDEQLMQRMKRQARETVLTKGFTLEQMQERYLSIFQPAGSKQKEIPCRSQ